MYKFLTDNKKIILFFLITICTISFIDTLRKGMLNGCDFQWQPSVLFWQGINHYERFILNGNWDFMCQGGQYSQIFHVILYPFTLFEWETAKLLWVIVNSCLAFVITLVLCKNLNISKYKTILLILIFLTCYPTRMTINYGQQSLFVLFFLILPFIYRSNLAVFFGGLSTIKYSTGYVLLLNFIVKKQWKNFFLASILYLSGWAIYSLYTNSNPIINFFILRWTFDFQLYESVLNNYKGLVPNSFGMAPSNIVGTEDIAVVLPAFKTQGDIGYYGVLDGLAAETKASVLNR